MVDDVVVNKASTIERCMVRVREEFGDDGGELAVDQRRQDALVLNLLRACETAIDLAMHMVRVRGLGVPQSSHDAFVRLVDAGLVDRELGGDLQRLVGIRNIAVHQQHLGHGSTEEQADEAVEEVFVDPERQQHEPN